MKDGKRNHRMCLIMEASKILPWLARKLKFQLFGVVNLKSFFDLGAGKPMSWHNLLKSYTIKILSAGQEQEREQAKQKSFAKVYPTVE